MQPSPWQKPYEQIVVDLLTQLEAGGQLTDVRPGSVVRTLVEAFARELAGTYEQLRLISDMAFVDTATADSLDRLVALLGQRRINGLRAEGRATFVRNPRVAGQITIPSGTQLLLPVAADRSVSYATTEQALLQPGQSQVTVPIACPVETEQEAPGALFTQAPDAAQLVQPIAGIAEVNVAEPTVARGYKEDDKALKERVMGLLESAGGGTAKAIEQAVLLTGKAKGVTLQDHSTPGCEYVRPGEVQVLLDAQPADFPLIRSAIYREKAPGILVALKAPTKLEVGLALTVKPVVSQLTGELRAELTAEIKTAVQRFFGELKSGDTFTRRILLARLMNLQAVADIPLAEITVTPTGGVTQPVGDELKAGPLERIVLKETDLLIRFDEGRTVRARYRISNLSIPADKRAAAQIDLNLAFEQYLAEVNASTNQPRQVLLADAKRVTLKPLNMPNTDAVVFELELHWTATGVEVTLMPGAGSGEPVGLDRWDVLGVNQAQGPDIQWG